MNSVIFYAFIATVGSKKNKIVSLQFIQAFRKRVQTCTFVSAFAYLQVTRHKIYKRIIYLGVDSLYWLPLKINLVFILALIVPSK